MWLQELSLLYEDWRGLSMDQTPQTKGLQPPQLAKPNLSIRNVKLGTDVPSMAADSNAGNVIFGNPYEQEEVINDKPISKLSAINIVDDLISNLNDSNPTDRVAIITLSKLRNQLIKL